MSIRLYLILGAAILLFGGAIILGPETAKDLLRELVSIFGTGA